MAAGYEEIIGPDQLLMPDRELTEAEMAALWRVFVKIESVWKFEPMAESFHSQWLDMVKARIAHEPSYMGEYINAAAVITELEQMEVGTWEDLLFFKTVVEEKPKAKSKLEHAKFYVVNDFIRCFILLGGFTAFGGKNYTGFMGGSRFADVAPVRTGGRQ
jgi:hypothetical protein